MLFVLGLITGLLVALIVVIMLTYFRKSIEHKTTIIEKVIENAGPRPKGFIVEPTSEAEEVRLQIIKKNQAQGKDTPLEDLR